MGSEAAAGGDFVIVDDSERFVAHVLRVMVVAEGKGMVGIEPAVVAVEAFVCPAKGEGSDSGVLHAFFIGAGGNSG